MSKEESGEPHQTAIIKQNQTKTWRDSSPRDVGRRSEQAFSTEIKRSQCYQGRWQGDLRVSLRAVSPSEKHQIIRFFSWKLTREGNKKALSSASAIPSLLEVAGGLMQLCIPPFQFSPQTQRQKNARNFPVPSPNRLPSHFPPPLRHLLRLGRRNTNKKAGIFNRSLARSLWDWMLKGMDVTNHKEWGFFKSLRFLFLLLCFVFPSPISPPLLLSAEKIPLGPLPVFLFLGVRLLL